MIKSLITISIVAALAGCVVAPYQPYRVVQPAPVQTTVVYPQYESAYVWDPVALSFFFVYSGQRHYMDRGWDYRRHGVPHGYYRHR